MKIYEPKRGIPLFIALIIIGTLVGGFVVWFFFVGSVPTSYTDCLKNHTNDYTRNQLSCSFSPRTPAEQRICAQKDGIINQFKQCLIIYYNPDFKFPSNLDECLQRIGSTNGQVCDVEINTKGAYDEQVTEKLFDDCLKNGGEDRSRYISTAGCSKRFQ